MAEIPDTQATDSVPTYLGRGDPAGRFVDYYPAWVDDDRLGDMHPGGVAVRPPGLQLRRPWGDNGFIEDYTAEIHGKPIGCLHLITFNADGQVQHVAAHYRPLSSLMFFSRLLRERVAGTPDAEHFLAGDA